MKDFPEDHLENDAESGSGSSGGEKIVRSVVESNQNDCDEQAATLIASKVDNKTPEARNGLEQEPNSTLRCQVCSTLLPLDSERCSKCGTVYSKDEITVEMHEAELDAELALDDTFEDSSQLFEQDKLCCGYFDVGSGVVAYVDPKDGDKGAVFECLNCKTIIELDVGRCPLCNEPLRKMEEGIVEIVDGLTMGEDLDMEVSMDIFCPMCGDLLMLENGHCIICDAELVSLSDEELSFLCPVVPSSNLVFLHLDVEDGDFNYILKREGASCEGKLRPAVEGSFEFDILTQKSDDSDE